MKDKHIIDLFWKRDENAIKETSDKYGRYCHAISLNIVSNQEDAKECVNDTYMAAWNTLPPNKPEVLATYLGKITRRISLNVWRNATRLKRGGGEVSLVFDELEDMIQDKNDVEKIIEHKILVQAVNDGLEIMTSVERDVFVCRYWYFASIEEICKKFKYSESKTKSILYRARKKLYDYLKKEGIV